MRTNLIPQAYQDRRRKRQAIIKWGYTLIFACLLLVLDGTVLWQESIKISPHLDTLRITANPISELLERQQSMQNRQKLLLERDALNQQALLPDATLQTMGVITQAIRRAGEENTALDSLEIRFGDGLKSNSETRLRIRARASDDDHAAQFVASLKSNERLADVTLQSAVSDRESRDRLLELVAIPYSPYGTRQNEPTK